METGITTARDQLHQQAIAASPRELAGLVQEVLTRRLTAFAVGTDDTSILERWASGDEREVLQQGVEERLRVAYEILLVLLAHDSPQTVRAWFFGRDPTLGDTSPAEAIRAGQFEDASLAATAFLANG